jgi:hypothetical protein
MVREAMGKWIAYGRVFARRGSTGSTGRGEGLCYQLAPSGVLRGYSCVVFVQVAQVAKFRQKAGRNVQATGNEECWREGVQAKVN